MAPDRPTNLWRDAWKRLRRNELAGVGPCIVVLLVLVAAVGPWLTPYDFLSQNLDGRNLPPSLAHPFGTDDLGRDVISRVISGARTAFLVVVCVTAIALTIGVILGAIAGFYGRVFDRFMMWFTDMTMSVPQLLLVMVINASLKQPISTWMEAMHQQSYNPIWRNSAMIDFVLVFGSMALISWPPYARLVRAQVLSIRNRPYVTAARALGLTNRIIQRRYVMPNAMGPLIVAVSAGLGTAMVLERAFSFLGVGGNPPMPSWGSMISDGPRVWTNYPHLFVAPAGVLAMVTVSFNFLGDGLNGALNPKGQK
jgi:ABC-type dipeptide/oligopeptide/nickel transport system permease subunit